MFIMRFPIDFRHKSYMPKTEMDYHQVILDYDKNFDALDDFMKMMICLPLLDNGKGIQQNDKGSYHVIYVKQIELDVNGNMKLQMDRKM